MATRFRKHSTRKTRRSKSLKTRKNRGGGLVNGLFHRKKDSTGNMMGSTGNAHAFLGIKKKGIFNKMKNFFTRKEKQDGGAGPMSISLPSIKGLFGQKSPMGGPGPAAMPSVNVTKKNNKTFGQTMMSGETHANFLNRKRKEGQKGGMSSILSKGKTLLNKITPQYIKNTETFMKYLDTLQHEVMHKLSHEQRMQMRKDLLQQLKQDKEILAEKRSMLGESRFSNILEKIEKIQNFVERNTNNQ